MGQDDDKVGQINHTLTTKILINAISLQTLLTKLGAMRAPMKVNRIIKTSNSLVSIDALTAAETAASILQTFDSSKLKNKPVVVSAIVPKQKTISPPKNTKPKVSQAQELIQKVIPGKGKATITKTSVPTPQVHNSGGPKESPELNVQWCLI